MCAYIVLMYYLTHSESFLNVADRAGIGTFFWRALHGACGAFLVGEPAWLSSYDLDGNGDGDAALPLLTSERAG